METLTDIVQHPLFAFISFAVGILGLVLPTSFIFGGAETKNRYGVSQTTTLFMAFLNSFRISK
jgi:hypothetical protein